MTPRIIKGIFAASLMYIGALLGGGNHTVQTLCVVVILSGFFVAIMNWREDRKRKISPPRPPLAGSAVLPYSPRNPRATALEEPNNEST